jgi:hypothetical protein
MRETLAAIRRDSSRAGWVQVESVVPDAGCFLIQDAGWAGASIRWHELIRMICVSVSWQRLSATGCHGMRWRRISMSR